MDVLERLVAAVQALRLLSMSPKSIEITERTEDLHEKSGEYVACTWSKGPQLVYRVGAEWLG